MLASLQPGTIQSCPHLAVGVGGAGSSHIDQVCIHFTVAQRLALHTQNTTQLAVCLSVPASKHPGHMCETCTSTTKLLTATHPVVPCITVDVLAGNVSAPLDNEVACRSTQQEGRLLCLRSALLRAAVIAEQPIAQCELLTAAMRAVDSSAPHAGRNSQPACPPHAPSQLPLPPILQKWLKPSVYTVLPGPACALRYPQ